MWLGNTLAVAGEHTDVISSGAQVRGYSGPLASGVSSMTSSSALGNPRPLELARETVERIQTLVRLCVLANVQTLGACWELHEVECIGSDSCCVDRCTGFAA